MLILGLFFVSFAFAEIVLIKEDYAKDQFSWLISVENPKDNQLLQNLDRKTFSIKPAKENVIFLWDDSRTMRNEVQNYPTYFQNTYQSFQDSKPSIKMYHFQDQREVLHDWLQDEQESAQLLRKHVSKEIPNTTQSKFFDSIIEVLDDGSSSDADVTHLFIYSDGLDDKMDTKSYKGTEEFENLQRALEKHTRIMPTVVFLDASQMWTNKEKYPMVQQNILEVCGQTKLECSTSNPPKRTKQYLTIRGNVCDIPTNATWVQKIGSKAPKCGRSVSFWYLFLGGVGIILAILGGLGWTKYKKKKAALKNRNIPSSAKDTVLAFDTSKAQKSKKDRLQTFTKTDEITLIIEYKVSIIQCNAKKNIGNYSNVNTTQVLLGNDESCDIVLDSPFVSGHHAMLKFGPSHVYIEDLDSSNGVQCNGEKILPFNPHMLTSGSIVTLGDMDLQILISQT